MQLSPSWKLTWFFYSHFMHKIQWHLFSACSFVKTLLWLNNLLTEISCLHCYGRNSLWFFAGSAVPQDYFWRPLLQLVIRLPFYMKGKRPSLSQSQHFDSSGPYMPMHFVFAWLINHMSEIFVTILKIVFPVKVEHVGAYLHALFSVVNRKEKTPEYCHNLSWETVILQLFPTSIFTGRYDLQLLLWSELWVLSSIV